MLGRPAQSGLIEFFVPCPLNILAGLNLDQVLMVGIEMRTRERHRGADAAVSLEQRFA